MPRIDALVASGLRGLECYYSRYSKDDERLLSGIADERGLLKSAGSDYHGKNKTVELGRLSSDDEENDMDISIVPALLDKYSSERSL